MLNSAGANYFYFEKKKKSKTRHIDQQDMAIKVTKAKTGQPKLHEIDSKENAKELELPSKLEEQANSFPVPNQKLTNPHLTSRTEQTGNKI